MLGKILISSSLVVISIFSAEALWKSLSDIKEAKQIQEHYEIVKDIKTQIALKYNINPENLTRNDIIAHLPKGENWEKILLLDRQKDSNLDNKEFINEQANITISEDEKLKLLALKLKENTSKIEVDTNKNININIAYEFKNNVDYEKIIDKRVESTVAYLYSEILAIVNNYSKDDTEIETAISNFLTNFKINLEEKDKTKNIYVPFEQIKLDLTDNEKIEFFKAKVKERIEQNSVGYEQRAVKFLKEKL